MSNSNISDNHSPESSPRQVPIQNGEVFFELGHNKNSSSKLAQNQSPPLSSISQATTTPEKTLPKNNPTPVKSSFQKKINKAWHALEFVSITAAIFMLFFFIFNFESYSQLFFTKLNQLRGDFSNPYTNQENLELKNASSEGQKPLPIATNAIDSKKQIPDLTMSIAPPDQRIIVPRIGQNVPVIQIPTDKLIQRDWTGLENQIQEALRHGVVHFPGTANPGDEGNVVITGHSSYFPWDPGRFKDVFALLHQVEVGDKVVVYSNQQKYEYEVYEKKVISPSQVEVLTQGGENRLTLLTCTPVGTDINRLVLLAKPL